MKLSGLVLKHPRWQEVALGSAKLGSVGGVTAGLAGIVVVVGGVVVGAGGVVVVAGGVVVVTTTAAGATSDQRET